MTKIFKPMLAATVENIEDLNSKQFPLNASTKLDGIRCVVRNGIAYSRSNKPIRNEYVQDTLNTFADDLQGFDGELIVGSETADDVYRTTNSAVMSVKGEPEFKFIVFDHALVKGTYGDRLSLLGDIIKNTPEFVQLVNNKNLNSVDEILSYEFEALALGYEGLIIRNLNAPYKNGRSTLKEGYLMKLKRFTDDEATIIGFGELMHNENEAETNELGRTFRSQKQEGKVASNMMGYMECRNQEGIEFKIGTGFSEDDRINFWNRRDELLGQLIKYKSFQIGVKEKPRHPVWLGFRDPIDM